MSDARWIEVEADMRASASHFEMAVALWRAGGFEGEGLEIDRAEMAFMHAIQSAHTSLEGGLSRIMTISVKRRRWEGTGTRT